MGPAHMKATGEKTILRKVTSSLFPVATSTSSTCCGGLGGGGGQSD